MRAYRPSAVLLLSIATCTTLIATPPLFDSIKYASPDDYLAIAESLGDPDAIRQQAQALKANDDRTTLSNVLRWMGANLKYDATRAYEWRNFDTVVQEKCYGGCADQAIVCGVLLQGAGIPTVWVKTMDVDWIWDFKKKRSFHSWSGHVFLEVFLDGKWVLLDPGAERIYKDYSPKSRILPGNRFAYHKGTDPKQMVMSLQWEEWKQQTEQFFTELDESLLPVDTRSIADFKPRIFIIANRPFYEFFGAIAHAEGLDVGPSFNMGYDEHLPMAKGNVILVETHAGIPIVDLDILRQYFPAVPHGMQRDTVISDGTTIVFVEVAPLVGQIATIAVKPPRPPALD